MRELGLYLHIPFCRKICAYCDFAKTGRFNEEISSRYFSSLKTSLEFWLSTLEKPFQVKTVFLGGGTPSLFSGEYFPLFETFSKHLSSNPEITMEINPEDIIACSLSLWKKLGINRLSIGVQSFSNRNLKFLDRTHTKDLLEEKLNLAQLYFNNISLDFIYGYPKESLKDLESNLDLALEFKAHHLSFYQLTYEKNTPFYTKLKRGLHKELDDISFETRYEIIRSTLSRNDYDHYEVSNFAKGGYKSQHNGRYWRQNEVLALGLGAHSLLFKNNEAWRFVYNRQLSKFSVFSYSVSVDKKEDLLLAYICAGLRTERGLDLEEISKKTFFIFDEGNFFKKVEEAKGKVSLQGHFLKLEAREWLRENMWIHKIWKYFRRE